MLNYVAARLGAVVAILAATTLARAEFDLAAIDRIAADLAARPYEAPKADLPQEAADWGYEEYRRVRFFPQHSVWFGGDMRYQLQFMARGYIYKEAVDVFTVEGGAAERVPFVPEHFEYLAADASRLVVPAGLGFAGFRIMHQSGEPLGWWEVASFIGASYWRAVGSGQVSGASVRGLGIDIGGSERFPRFTRYWIVRPEPAAESITVMALLEDEVVTGAYRFVITPGEATSVAVTAHLFQRPGLNNVCLAPITSMFFRGESDKAGARIIPGTANEPGPPDMRPEVHDSDGLLIHEGGDRWSWRTLSNPPRPSLSQIGVDRVHGFGLIQRDTAFESFVDYGATYHRRPSVWVTPDEPWGPGRVDLLLWPAVHEGIDNVAASFRPAAIKPPGERIDLAYTVQFRKGDPVEHLLGRFDTVKLKPDDAGGGLWRGQLNVTLSADIAGNDDAAIAADFTASAGKLSNVTVTRAKAAGAAAGPGTWRIAFDLDPGDAHTIELSGRLKVGDRACTETWNTTWIRPQK